MALKIKWSAPNDNALEVFNTAFASCFSDSDWLTYSDPTKYSVSSVLSLLTSYVQLITIKGITLGSRLFLSDIWSLSSTAPGLKPVHICTQNQVACMVQHSLPKKTKKDGFYRSSTIHLLSCEKKKLNWSILNKTWTSRNITFSENKLKGQKPSQSTQSGSTIYFRVARRVGGGWRLIILFLISR